MYDRYIFFPGYPWCFNSPGSNSTLRRSRYFDELGSPCSSYRIPPRGGAPRPALLVCLLRRESNIIIYLFGAVQWGSIIVLPAQAFSSAYGSMARNFASVGVSLLEKGAPKALTYEVLQQMFN